VEKRFIRHGPYLLVLRDDGSWRVPLPADGEFVVGSHDDADLRITEELGQTLLLRMVDSNALLEPCSGDGSRVSCVEVNGMPANSPVALAPGDTVTFGTLTIIFHGPTPPASHSAAVGAEEIRLRLLEETERSQRSGRPLAVLMLDLATVDASARPAVVDEVCRLTRLIDRVAWDGQSDLFVLLPDTSTTVSIPAQRIMAALISKQPGIRGGYSICPTDAWEAETLLAGARHAARVAPPGTVAALSSSVELFQVGPLKFVAVDPVMRKLLGLVKRLALSDLPILLVGETGSGKEVVAQAIHYWSHRATGPLVTANCAAIAPTLFESELFGHVRGSFTGATEARAGLLESAQGGTVLLDEIGDCPLGCQPKLLRAIETLKISRVGATSERPVNIRIVAATNRDLEAEVSRNNFRQDLFFRLNIARISVPPLRERPLDIPVLARFFLEQACSRSGRPPITIGAETLQRLAQHSWPGNVRELKNTMELCAVTLDGNNLTVQDLPNSIVPGLSPRTAQALDGPVDSSAGETIPLEPFDSRRIVRLRDEIAELERLRILQALESTGGLQNRAAELLHMPLRTFVSKMRHYGISGPRGSYRRGEE